MLLPIHPEALIELDHAMTWHERERVGYGLVLLDEVSAEVEQAARFPRSGTSLTGFEPHHDVRKYVVRRFRYVVITALTTAPTDGGLRAAPTVPVLLTVGSAGHERCSRRLRPESQNPASAGSTWSHLAESNR